MRIKASLPASEFILRQTPGGSGKWGGDQFVVSEDRGDPFDAWAVYERLAGVATAVCDPGRTILITGEPESVRKYDHRFLSQFAAIVTPRADLKHPNIIQTQPAIPWWAGVEVAYPAKTKYSLDYDAFKAMRSFEKPKLLSIVSTTKTQTPGHRDRLEFVRALKRHFGERLDLFGHGFTPVKDKWDAIAPYRYHIVLENSCSPHYWTEKIADTFLGGAFPLYSGCPNLDMYFPVESFRAIARDDVGKSIGVIEEAIASDQYERSVRAIAEARERVLDQYNLFPVIAGVAARLRPMPRRRVRLFPEEDFTDPVSRRFKRRVKRALAFCGWT